MSTIREGRRYLIFGLWDYTTTIKADLLMKMLLLPLCTLPDLILIDVAQNPITEIKEIHLRKCMEKFEVVITSNFLKDSNDHEEKHAG